MWYPLGVPLTTDPQSWTVFAKLSLRCIRLSTCSFRVTWRHRSCDQSIRYILFPIGAPLEPRLYLQRFFEILRNKCIWVTTLTVQGYVTSSITWPFDSQYVISYWCFFDTYPLSWTVLEILSFKCIQKQRLARGKMVNGKWLPYFIERLKASA